MGQTKFISLNILFLSIQSYQKFVIPGQEVQSILVYQLSNY